MYEAATSLAFFLLDKTGSVNGKWSGKMSAKEQRALIGRFLGRGRLVIDGNAQTVKHIVKVCFGHDFDVRANVSWRDL